MASEDGKSFARWDKLREIEVKVQKWWDEKDIFKAEPWEKPPSPGEKFFGSLPYPYMNGYLHLGHAFSISKLEFASSAERCQCVIPFCVPLHGNAYQGLS